MGDGNACSGLPSARSSLNTERKISRTPQYWRPSNCLMQLCIQTCRSYEAKPGGGGYQATLIPSEGSGGGPRRGLVVEQRVDTEATLSSSDRSGSEAASRFFVAPSPDPLPTPSDLEQHRRTPREERNGGKEWGFVDDRELDSFWGHRSCSTCGHFGFAFLSQCQLLGC